MWRGYTDVVEYYGEEEMGGNLWNIKSPGPDDIEAPIDYRICYKIGSGLRRVT